MRNSYNMTGIKIIVTSSGICYKISVSAIILQLACFIALMKIPSIICDFILLNFTNGI